MLKIRLVSEDVPEGSEDDTNLFNKKKFKNKFGTLKKISYLYKVSK